MMMHKTLNQLRSLRLETMAQAPEQQLTESGLSAMSFEERLAMSPLIEIVSICQVISLLIIRTDD